MINIAVTDDEPEMLELVSRRVSEEFSKTGMQFTVSRFDTGSGFLGAFENGTGFDILFLDIKLSDCTGMELARKLREAGSRILIVFVTSFDNYVFEAFDYEAQGYLRKSELDERLGLTVKRLVRKYNEDHREIMLNNQDGQIKIAVNDIAYFESHAHTITMFGFDGGEFLFTGSLSKLEKEYRAFGFFRVHSGYLVNMYHVYSIEKNDAVIRLVNKEIRIPISRSKLRGFRDAYQRNIRGV